jgi:hypothetical protein
LIAAAFRLAVAEEVYVFGGLGHVVDLRKRKN